jgi:hypothetical protein
LLSIMRLSASLPSQYPQCPFAAGINTVHQRSPSYRLYRSACNLRSRLVSQFPVSPCPFLSVDPCRQDWGCKRQMPKTTIVISIVSQFANGSLETHALLSNLESQNVFCRNPLDSAFRTPGAGASQYVAKHTKKATSLSMGMIPIPADPPTIAAHKLRDQGRAGNSLLGSTHLGIRRSCC